MTEDQVDRWATWLLHARHGGDETALRQHLALLMPIRDRVLADAKPDAGDVVLDVGCGDGLIGFGALSAVGESGRIIFTDVSEQLLDRCRDVASVMNVADQCEFVRCPAETLAGVETSSVDVVTARSVLIYVQDKPAAFAAFQRVLKPGGRISIFEPINRRYETLNQDTLFGYDVAPVAELAAKVRAVFEGSAPPNGPMLGFDETDLLYFAEAAGFEDITVNLELTSTNEAFFAGLSWDQVRAMSPNPNAPTYGAAIDQALTTAEAATLEAHLRPLVEDSASGRVRNAVSYLSAIRT